MQIDYSKARYLFDGVTLEELNEEMAKAIRSFLTVENIYASAIREITTKLENLNDEFKVTMDRNPIHQIKARVKTPKSIAEKLIRKGYELSIQSAKENLNDIAGVRVICSYIDDIYMIEEFLTSQEDIKLLKRTDYIQNPKPNGYRSLHLVVAVPVSLYKSRENVKVEIQIRTIAMDFWASLEHDLAYKLPEGKKEGIVRELKDCADVIAQVDMRMQKLYKMITNGQALKKE